ncbi:hypothetical protein CO659_12550 [Rhizobium sp. S9]|uniref:hypothetical protein n=1 Tax=Rhizobium sp. S9 TaxID=2035454 RepID=UPI000BE90CEA|nr:hypothetical protein [Rhizobium sp. S9]PDS97493.1 hypothetical protein CO659_12550 [Rhizobium sp. S9]
MLHYYMFSFVAGNNTFARVTIGWPDASVTESRIAFAREKAIGKRSDACPLAVSYLGQMTPEVAVS